MSLPEAAGELATGERKLQLGPEWDEALRRLVLDVLRDLGASFRSHRRGAAGSQEVDMLELEVEGESIFVESETYVGLSIRGGAALIDRVDAQVRERLRAREA